MASARISSALAAAALLLLAPGAAADPELPPAEAAQGFQPRRVATDLARVLERMYLDPETGRQYAAAIRRNAAAGAYDDFRDRAGFATRLTADLQQVAPEGHLRIISGRSQPQQPQSARPPTMEGAGWIAPGIAYVRLNNMLGSPSTLSRLRQFMETHADARRLILDLRGNSGGGVSEMDIILPWLYREPTLLMRMDSRDGIGPNPMADIPSMRPEPAPRGIRRFDHWVEPVQPTPPIAGADVYVLTSGATISAAEHMVMALQHTGRARVIGEKTSGAGHYGPIVRLADGFTVFVPVGRSYAADTGRGWEGDGIAPDIAVPQDEALSRALALSGLPEKEVSRIAAGMAADRHHHR